jgi:hypothetical protein
MSPFDIVDYLKEGVEEEGKEYFYKKNSLIIVKVFNACEGAW